MMHRLYSMMVGAQAFCDDACPAACEVRVLANCIEVVAAKPLAEVPQTARHTKNLGTTSTISNRLSQMRDKGKASAAPARKGHGQGQLMSVGHLCCMIHWLFPCATDVTSSS
jgi:hypothetical protein